MRLKQECMRATSRREQAHLQIYCPSLVDFAMHDYFDKVKTIYLKSPTRDPTFELEVSELEDVCG